MDYKYEVLRETLTKYSKSFSDKQYIDNFDDSDVLMECFGITKELKSENKQYWGRELGKCWESILKKVFELYSTDFEPPKRYGADEPADFFVGLDAIDTKYRVGSGDSGTLKKFETYGKLLTEHGYRPVFLFLRSDNLNSALSKMKSGGWTFYFGDETFRYVLERTGFDLKDWLIKMRDEEVFKIKR